MRFTLLRMQILHSVMEMNCKCCNLVSLNVYLMSQNWNCLDNPPLAFARKMKNKTTTFLNLQKKKVCSPLTYIILNSDFLTYLSYQVSHLFKSSVSQTFAILFPQGGFFQNTYGRVSMRKL